MDARVVSMPSFEVFEEQDAAYREGVLPNAVRPAWPWRPPRPWAGTSTSAWTAMCWPWRASARRDRRPSCLSALASPWTTWWNRALALIKG